MRELAVLAPGPLDRRTGGYEYDRRMIAGLRQRGWNVDVRELGAGFPQPTRETRDDAARQLAAIADGAAVLIDGLAFGALPDEVEREASRLRLIALVHLPLAAEIGIDRETAARLEASERRALAAAVRVVVTGKSTAALLSSTYGVSTDRIAVVEPGTEPAPLSRGSIGAPLQLLSVAAITAGKGHEVLVRALESVPNRNWFLTCAGSLDRDPAAVGRLRARLDASGLGDHVSLPGELKPDDLESCYNSADVFVLATLHETYCMAVAEALARGVPVVSTTTGAIPELVGGGNGGDPAGLLAPAGDVEALAKALATVIGDARCREQLAKGARQARERLPTWDMAIDTMAALLNDVV